MHEQTQPAVKVYGADWCHVTTATREYLDELGVAYTYVDTDADADASAWVKSRNNGLEIKPTLQIGENVLGAPGAEELRVALRSARLVD